MTPVHMSQSRFVHGGTCKYSNPNSYRWNITLLGYFDPTALGNITLGVSLDGQTQNHVVPNGESPRHGAFTYFEYFTLVQRELDSGNHTIIVEVLEASLSQTFGFRGFTYIPGFATLNDMHDLSAVSASTSSPSHGGGSGQSSHQEPLRGGAIAGVVVGAIAGICLIQLILWAAWRQIKERRTLSPAQA
ncbi:hypothetical protein BDP27DRAFT_1429053 [Rhodocollybia butyracea]|uniref:Uncharacterized protein n=1 Tax=Rhodocollybia butyracea TaxID=206335 RepID=A0A9P5PDV0_9AGAR|nr:hypothetical protein BDP27DRAFT_1429053 [Rhodocollybia butyracea]